MSEYFVHETSYIDEDVTIGKDCIVDKVIATTKLRIHKSAQVKDFIGSVMPEYFE